MPLQKRLQSSGQCCPIDFTAPSEDRALSLLRTAFVALLFLEVSHVSAGLARACGWAAPLDFQPVEGRGASGLASPSSHKSHYDARTLGCATLCSMCLNFNLSSGDAFCANAHEGFSSAVQNNIQVHATSCSLFAGPASSYGLFLILLLASFCLALSHEIIRREHLRRVVRAAAESHHTLSEALADAEAARFEARHALVSCINHEIRTPLNAISSAAALLADTPVSPEQRELLDILDSGAGHVCLVVDDMLSLHALDKGEFQIAVASADISKQILDPAWKLLHLQPRHQDKLETLRLFLTVDESVPKEMETDGVRVLQIMCSLLSNAVKFSHPGGRIVLSVDTVAMPLPDNGEEQADEDGAEFGDFVRFRVSDDGIGIAPEMAALCFEPFFQVDSATDRQYGGTGMGLAISRRLAAALGGSLEVRSEGLGRGSSFSLCVPLPRRRNDAAAATDPAADTAAGRVMWAGGATTAPRRHRASTDCMRSLTKTWETAADLQAASDPLLRCGPSARRGVSLCLPVHGRESNSRIFSGIAEHGGDSAAGEDTGDDSSSARRNSSRDEPRGSFSTSHTTNEDEDSTNGGHGYLLWPPVSNSAEEEGEFGNSASAVAEEIRSAPQGPGTLGAHSVGEHGIRMPAVSFAAEVSFCFDRGVVGGSRKDEEHPEHPKQHPEHPEAAEDGNSSSGGSGSSGAVLTPRGVRDQAARESIDELRSDSSGRSSSLDGGGSSASGFGETEQGLRPLGSSGDLSGSRSASSHSVASTGSSPASLPAGSAGLASARRSRSSTGRSSCNSATSFSESLTDLASQLQDHHAQEVEEVEERLRRSFSAAGGGHSGGRGGDGGGGGAKPTEPDAGKGGNGLLWTLLGPQATSCSSLLARAAAVLAPPLLTERPRREQPGSLLAEAAGSLPVPSGEGVVPALAQLRREPRSSLPTLATLAAPAAAAASSARASSIRACAVTAPLSPVAAPRALKRIVSAPPVDDAAVPVLVQTIDRDASGPVAAVDGVLRSVNSHQSWMAALSTEHGSSDSISSGAASSAPPSPLPTIVSTAQPHKPPLIAVGGLGVGNADCERKRRLLVAEDDRLNQALIKKILVKLGYEVTLVENGLLAVEAMKTQAFDLILMVMDGHVATRQIRKMIADGVCKETPVVALSASCSDEEKRRCGESGMACFIPKPLKLDALSILNALMS